MDEKYRRSPRVSFIEKAAAAGWRAYFAQLARALFVLLKLQLFPSPPPLPPCHYRNALLIFHQSNKNNNNETPGKHRGRRLKLALIKNQRAIRRNHFFPFSLFSKFAVPLREKRDRLELPPRNRESARTSLLLHHLSAFEIRTR